MIARHGLEPLKAGDRFACEKPACRGQADGATSVAWQSRVADVRRSSTLMRPGDVLTHCYSGAPNIAGEGTNIVQEGRLLPAALAAKRRGVVFDVGHGV